jgi:hypothetical protein
MSALCEQGSEDRDELVLVAFELVVGDAEGSIALSEMHASRARSASKACRVLW